MILYFVFEKSSFYIEMTTDVLNVVEYTVKLHLTVVISAFVNCIRLFVRFFVRLFIVQVFLKICISDSLR